MWAVDVTMCTLGACACVGISIYLVRSITSLDKTHPIQRTRWALWFTQGISATLSALLLVQIMRLGVQRWKEKRVLNMHTALDFKAGVTLVSLALLSGLLVPLVTRPPSHVDDNYWNAFNVWWPVLIAFQYATYPRVAKILQMLGDMLRRRVVLKGDAPVGRGCC